LMNFLSAALTLELLDAEFICGSELEVELCADKASVNTAIMKQIPRIDLK